MSAKWIVQCQVEHSHTDSHGREWHGSVQVPTFFLGDGVHRDSVEAVAREIVDPLGKAVRIHVSWTAV